MVVHLNRLIQAAPAVPISGLALDSRQVKPGDLFLAVTGAALQGQAFITEAIDKGAVAILSDKNTSEKISVPFIYLPELKNSISTIAAEFYGHPANQLNIMGVTGTNGKTSCTHFIASILKQLGESCGVIGTLGIGLLGEMHGSGLTTPDPITLQKNFFKWVNEGVSHVAMEVSSHSIDQNRIANIPFKVGIFTNLTRDHLDYHGTMAAYGSTKKSWFLNSKMQAAVINQDDIFGQEIIAAVGVKMPIYGYSQSSVVSNIPLIQAKNVHCDKTGLRAQITSPWGAGELRSPLMGRFNMSNLLASISTLCLQDIPLKYILDCVPTLSPVEGRMQTFGGGNLPIVVVDYSHTPDALEKALQALRDHCEGKLHCVFGCGGDRDKGKRPMMAKIAERYADTIIVTDDNPRFENPAHITNDIYKGFSSLTKATLEHDRARAISQIISSANSGDCVLIAGKGAEAYQLIKDKKIPFKDEEEVNKALNHFL